MSYDINGNILVRRLKLDLLILARRLALEDENTFAPETLETMSRWREEALNQPVESSKDKLPRYRYQQSQPWTTSPIEWDVYDRSDNVSIATVYDEKDGKLICAALNALVELM